MGQDRREEPSSLSALLEQDREMVMAQLSADRTQDQALKVLEKETERLMYKAAAQNGAHAGAAQNGVQAGAVQNGTQAAAAQGMLQVLKNALPLVSCVSDSEVWERQAGKEKAFALSVPSIVSAAAGVICVIAGLAGGGLFGLFRVLWSVGGCALLLLGGFLAGKGQGKPGKDGKKAEEPVQQSFLVDPDRIWHILQGTLLGADHTLKTDAEYARAVSARDMEAPAGGMRKEDLQFFADLLENAYARRRKSPSDEALTEQVETIRYYLHARGIETEDYSAQSARWFEMLPSEAEAVTIRPALLSDGVLIMKGVASGH